MVGIEFFLPVEEGLMAWGFGLVCLRGERRRGRKEERDLRDVGPGAHRIEGRIVGEWVWQGCTNG